MTATLTADPCAILSARLRADGSNPIVVPLGLPDVLRPDQDTAYSDRRTATVHVTPQAVLLGPWGTSPCGPAACGHCLAIRWQDQRPRIERETQMRGTEIQAVGDWPLLTDAHLDAISAAYQHMRSVTAAGPRVTRIDLCTLAVQTVPILHVPTCPSCVPETEPSRSGAILTLEPRIKPAPTTYRLRTPHEYALPAAALANPVCGAIGSAAVSILGSPTTAPVVGGTLMRGHSGLFDVRWSGHGNAYAGSRDLAFLEGLERYAGTRPRNRVRPIVDSYHRLAPDALDPRDCGVYSDTTYASAHEMRPFDPDRPIPWVWGYSLRDARPILVPHRLAYYSTGTGGDNFVIESSNGCASGGSIEEAILFGLLELIERDAFLLGWYGDADLTRIDIGRGGDPTVRTMIDRAGLQGYDVHVFDNRIDLAIPVVTGVAVRRDGGSGLLSFASGASLDPDTAIRAALSEILSYIPAMPRVVRSRRDELAAMVGDYTRVRGLTDHAGLFGLPEMAVHARRYLHPERTLPMADVYRDWSARDTGTGNLTDDVAVCRDELVRAGYDVIVVDQTAPEQAASGLRSVAMIVPGLLPIDFGWARQRAVTMPRMFSAYRRAGWRSTDLAPTDVRMIPHPFP